MKSSKYLRYASNSPVNESGKRRGRSQVFGFGSCGAISDGTRALIVRSGCSTINCKNTRTAAHEGRKR